MSNESTFTALDAVLRYGVDNHGAVPGSDICNRIGIDQKTFYHHLYVDRPEIESIVKTHILYRSDMVCITGPAGSGKTSLLRCVLARLRGELRHLVFLLDFKQIYSEIEAAHDEASASDALWRAIDASLHNYLPRHKVMSSDLVRTFFTRAGLNFQLGHAAAVLRADISNLHLLKVKSGEYGPSAELSDWLDHCVLRREEQVESLVDSLEKSLHPSERLFALTRYEDPSGKTKAVIALDNIDTINNPSARSSVLSFVRKLQPTIAHCARVIATVRPSSIDEAELDAADWGAYNSGIQSVELPSYGVQGPIAADKELEPEADPIQGQSERDPDSPAATDAQESDLDQRILYRRVRYLEAKATSLDGVSREKLHEMTALTNRLRAIRRFHRTLSDIANHDRRFVTIKFSTFAKEVLSACERVGKRPSLHVHDLWLESSFYAWLAADSMKPTADAYSLSRSVRDWERSSTRLLGCSLSHLMLSHVYKKTGMRPSRYSFGASVSVGSILKKTSEIGISDVNAIEALQSCYRGRFGIVGLIDIVRGNRRSRHELIDEKDHISILPRGCCLVESLGQKFYFLLGTLDSKRPPTYDSILGGLSHIDVDKMLRFLCRVARMHLCGLSQIKEHSRSVRSWFTQYRVDFGLDLYMPHHPGEGHGSLLIEAIFGSHLKFFRQIISVSQDQMEAEVARAAIAKYESLRKAFRTQLERLVAEPSIAYKPDSAEVDLSALFFGGANIGPTEESSSNGESA